MSQRPVIALRPVSGKPSAEVLARLDKRWRVPYLLLAPHRLGFFLAMLVLVTSGLFFDLPLPLAVIGHEGGTVLVVLNGLRLLSDGIRGGDGSAPVQRQPDPPTSVRPEFPSRTTSPTAS